MLELTHTHTHAYTCMPAMMLPDIPMKPRYSTVEWVLTRNSCATLLMAYKTTPTRQSKSPSKGFAPNSKGKQRKKLVNVVLSNVNVIMHCVLCFSSNGERASLAVIH